MEDFSIEPFKKYIYLAIAVLAVILIGIAINSSIDSKNQAAWSAVDNASGSVELEKVYAAHKNSIAGPWIGFSLANSLYAEGKINDAAEVFKEVASMNTNYLTPYAMQGCAEALQTLGKNDDAQKYFDRITTEFKDSVPAELLKKK